MNSQGASRKYFIAIVQWHLEILLIFNAMSHMISVQHKYDPVLHWAFFLLTTSTQVHWCRITVQPALMESRPVLLGPSHLVLRTWWCRQAADPSSESIMGNKHQYGIRSLPSQQSFWGFSWPAFLPSFPLTQTNILSFYNIVKGQLQDKFGFSNRGNPTCSPRYSTSKASCRRILLSSVGPPVVPVVLVVTVFLACFSLFKLSSIFFTELKTSDMVSKYLPKVKMENDRLLCLVEQNKKLLKLVRLTAMEFNSMLVGGLVWCHS